MEVNEACKGKMILTSFGLTGKRGAQLIGMALEGKDLSDKNIYLWYEPYLSSVMLLKGYCVRLGFQEKNIKLLDRNTDISDISGDDYIYVGEGEPSQIMDLIREDSRDVEAQFKRAFKEGAIYIGASAGAVMAGVSIEQPVWKQKRKVCMPGLALFNGIVKPHKGCVYYGGADEQSCEVLFISDYGCVVLNGKGEVVAYYEGGE